ncbi:MAG: MBL fold metallo-hydrolase [Candidatus Bathyarchaeia archaeon]|nr:MBL fold metallo-hydrolase [Candidatus Bathyarchaeota archaeon]
MANIRFYGGVDGCIGGNQIVLEDDSATLLLDFGLNYRIWSSYFEFIFSEPESIDEVIRVGLAPDNRILSSIDACILSHAHTDHWRLITILPEDTRILLGECTYRIIEGWSKRVRRKTILYRTSHLRFDTFRTGSTIRIGDIEVKPISVDHSIPGAYGFHIYTPSGLIVYTGDFRLHGRFKPRVDLFEDLEDRVSLLICEGTNIGRLVEPMSESDVYAKASSIVEECRGLVVVDIAPADLDRLNTMIEVAYRVGRRVVCSDRIIDTITDLSGDKLLKVPRIGEDVEPLEDVGDSCTRNPDKYMLITCLYSEREVRRIKPPPGSIYLLSCSEPFEEERELAFNRLSNWLCIFGVSMYHIHSSGHAYPLDIRRIVERIRPKAVAAIHTEHPDTFRYLLSDLTRVYTFRRGDELRI